VKKKREGEIERGRVLCGEGEERKEGERREEEKGKGLLTENEGEKGREKKRGRGREGWDMCLILGGWEGIMLSPPSQPRDDTWQGESPLYFKTPTFIKLLQDPTLLKILSFNN
jgi:hypothetical protein